MYRPPKASLLRIFRAERVDHMVVIGEAVDNALDAGAHQIAIYLDDHRIAFRDNGIGMNERRLDAFVTIADHQEMPTTALGRYGAGIKIQAVNAADRIRVESTALDSGQLRSFTLDIDWRAVERAEWNYPDPHWRPTLIDAPTGTYIEMTHLRPALRRSDNQIIEDLSRRFRPAILPGCAIFFNQHPVPLLPDPVLIDAVDRELMFDDRSAHIVAGVLSERSKMWGIDLTYKHRTIVMNSAFGADGHGGLTKMFARVDLLGPWHLDRFKNDLADQKQRDELEEAVAEILAPILERCETQTFDARIDGIEEWINANLPPDKIAARPKHKKPKSEEPPPEPPKPKRPKSSPPDVPVAKVEIGKGPVQSRATQKGKLKIEFVDTLELQAICAFKAGRPDRVLLAKDSQTIAALLHYRDEKFARSVLRDLGLIFYAQANFQEPDLFGFGSFVSQLLAINIITSSEAIPS